jgi:hypothetical protein
VSDDDRVYIHEFINITLQNRAKYLQHITANWGPTAYEERRQVIWGIWGTIGSTGRWPEVVNIMEHSSYENMARSFGMEQTPTLQDPFLEKWWAEAASLRSGGFDRILRPASYSRSVAKLNEDGFRAASYAHEIITLPLGTSHEFLHRLEEDGKPQVEALGVELAGAFWTTMTTDSECILVWAFPEWDKWIRYERAWAPGGELDPWHKTCVEMGASIDRTILMDAPLSPLKTGRQPQKSDQRPME